MKQEQSQNIRNLISRLMLSLIFLVFSSAAQAGLNEGIAAYKSKNYRVAIREFMALAAKGNATAQFNLGVINELGQGVRPNYPKSVSRYSEAAKQGHARAQLKLGVIYANGKWVTQDYNESAAWLIKAADQGNALAQFDLAVMYAKGLGV
ncbi:MAG: tetratricopeptide repeat protein, partial [Gallionellaceae bacterium]